MLTLDSILVTGEYWFDSSTCYHVVFAKSLRIAREYSRAKGFELKGIDRPKALDLPFIIHNANVWFEKVLFTEGN